VQSIDLRRRTIHVSHGLEDHGHDLPFDHLVLALGSSVNFFNLPGVEDFAVTMKSLTDAVELRNRIVTHLEEANSECAAGERHPLLTFVVAGGGFAGVETLGAINDFIRDAISFYPNLKIENMKMVLVTPEDLILPELNHRLRVYAQRKIEQRGIELITGARVEGVDEGVVSLSTGRHIHTSTLIWTAGNASNPLIASLGLPTRGGRVVVDEYLRVEGTENVWAAGDCAAVRDGKGGYHPATAQHALREARVLADNLSAVILGRRRRRFCFSTIGQLAAIGRRTGVANILGINFSGFVAWWLWRTVYLSKLPRLEKKLRVALDWTLDLLFAKDFACVNAAHSAYSRPISADTLHLRNSPKLEQEIRSTLN
jgi:NADH dehydrogenase